MMTVSQMARKGGKAKKEKYGIEIFKEMGRRSAASKKAAKLKKEQK